MKKFLLAALGMLCLTSYAQQQCCQLEHPCFAYDATMYELNTRQLTEEGTFQAAEAVLPELREMGIDIIYIHKHYHSKVLIHYRLADIDDINTEFRTLGARHSDNSYLVLTYNRNNCLHNIRSFSKI